MSLKIPILKVLFLHRSLWWMSPRKGRAGNERLRINPPHKGDFTFRSGDYLEWKTWIFISSMVFFPMTNCRHSRYSQCSSQPVNSRSCRVLSSPKSPKMMNSTGKSLLCMEKHFSFLISYRILESQKYSMWKSPPRASNPNIPQFFQAYHNPMSPNATSTLKCQLKSLFPVFAGQISQTFSSRPFVTP